MVNAHYRLVTEHLGIRRLRLVLGFSMGGMKTWILAQKHPRLTDIAVPMASVPTEMSGRNWILRRLIIDSIRNDPEWKNGTYSSPLRSAQFASVFYGLATNGGNQALQKAAPTREKAGALLNNGSAPSSPPTPTMSSTSGNPRATTAPPQGWSGSRRRCLRSTRRTTSVIHQTLESWTVRSSGSRMAAYSSYRAAIRPRGTPRSSSQNSGRTTSTLCCERLHRAEASEQQRFSVASALAVCLDASVVFYVRG
jgi:homoserine acetyltransferase